MTTATRRRRAILSRRWNADGSISLLSRGRVVFKTSSYGSVEIFARGWFGSDAAVRWGKSQFAPAVRARLDARARAAVEPHTLTEPKAPPMNSTAATLETLTAPAFVIVEDVSRYGSRDEYIGLDRRVVDCARTEAHAFLIVRRLCRDRCDETVSVRVFRPGPDGALRTQVPWPMRPALVEPDDLPF